MNIDTTAINQQNKIKIELGHMAYINTFPLFHYLKDDPNLSFVQGTPQELNEMLQNSTLTCGFASAVTYLHNSHKYDIMPFCIGAYHKVESVVLFSKEPIEFLHDKTIYTTPESATSTALLKLIIQKFIGIKPKYTTDTTQKERSTAQLLIGDEALKHYHNQPEPYLYDISELWNLLTGHASVFGLLLIAKNTPVDTKKYLHKAMTIAYDKHQENLDVCYDAMTDKQKFLPKNTVVDYWKLLEYQLNPIMISSLLGMFTMIENNTLKHQDEHQNNAYTLTSAAGKVETPANTPQQQFKADHSPKPSPQLSLVDENGETYTI